MTWKDFIEPIESSNLIENNTDKEILMKLFKVAEPYAEISVFSIAKWLKNERNCKVKRYFPEDCINNPKKVFDFFRKRSESKLKELQKIFREKYGNKNIDTPIDLDTEDIDIFCCSLLNQFLELLGFEQMELSDVLKEKKGNFINNEQMPSHQNTGISNIGAAKHESTASVSKENKEQQKELSDIFTDNYVEFGVQKFIRSYCMEDAFTFITRIKYNYDQYKNEKLDKFIDSDTDVYNNISNFADILWEYLSYLRENMKECHEGNQYKHIYNGDSEDEFKKETDKYRKQLVALYQNINMELQKKNK